MTREETIRAIKEYFEEHEEMFNDCIEELDSYNGYLGDDRYYPMEEIDEFYNGVEPSEILARAFYGYDAETWHTDAHGEKEYGAFCPNREFFSFNGYGNLVSSDYKDYSDKLDDYAIEAMSENRRGVSTIEGDDELAALFDALEECEE